MATVSGEYRLQVRYDECDSMGITYHANYLDWFVIGRTELLRDFGLPYAELERSGLLLPVLEARCRYHSSTTYDDRILLKTQLLRVTRTRMEFRYDVFVERSSRTGAVGGSEPRASSAQQTNGKPGDQSADSCILAAEGETSHAFIDDRHRPVDVKKRFPEVWAKLEPLAASLRKATTS